MDRTNTADQGRLGKLAASAFAMVAAVVLFSSIITAQPSGAQTPTPTPTPTGPSIQFLNPSGGPAATAAGPGVEISNKPDPGTTYSVVAWASSVPSGATAEFTWTQTANSQTFNMTQDGPDSFVHEWNLAGTAEGAITLTVKMFVGGAEVARDELTGQINNSPAEEADIPSPNDEAQGEAVTISYPTVASQWGLYTPQGGTSPAGVIEGTSSADTDNVSFFYSKSAPGTEPAWTACTPASATKTSFDTNGARCALAAGDAVTSVTAVAARAEAGNTFDGVPNSNYDSQDSGDAVRVYPYAQVPTSMTITPAQQVPDVDADGAFPCSGEIRAKVLDQASTPRPISGVNVDSHMVGPTDNAGFDDFGSPDTGSSPHGPPNAPDTHQPAENTVDCESTNDPPPSSSTSKQGEHERSPDADIKHIESTSGTSNKGEFFFKVGHRDTGPGSSQVIVWADTDDDDKLCSLEKRAETSVGWGQAPPAPGGFTDEVATCTLGPSPSPSPSATGTPSPSPTSTASPTPSPSASPSPEPRSITLAADKGKVTTGATVGFNGQVFSTNAPECIDQEFIRIRERVLGTQTFEEKATTTSSDDGTFSLDIKVKDSAQFVAFAPAHDNCADATSGPVTVLAKVKVKVSANPEKVDKGKDVTFKGSVSPDETGPVILQRKKGNKWVKVEDAKLKNSKFEFTIEAKWKGKRSFRVRWPGKGQEDHEPNNSNKVVVKSVT